MIEQSQRTATKSELFDKLLKSLFIAVFFSAFVFPRTIYGCSVMHSNAPIDRFDDADYAGPTDCDTLKSYAGMYGPIRITYDDDGLFILESGEKNLKKLYPLSETLFVIEGNEKIRGQFERDGKGEVLAVIGIIAEGSKQRILKTREKMEKPERTADETLRDDDSQTSPGGVNDKIFDELDIEFAYVEGGSFQMGDTFGEGRRSEIPVHNVILDGFYLSTTEVTFAQYDRFCEDTGREKPDDKGYGRGNLPVINVNWNDAVAFCLWLSEKSGRPVRLPTEAEWEYAARERGEKVRFGNGQDIADPSEINFDGREKHKEPYSRLGADAQKILPVASSPCNSLGLYDMSGNVWEWVADWFDENYYRNSPVENPTGPSIGTYRVLRGGAWRFGPRSARCANRGSYIPGEGNSEIGFRLAITK